MDDAELPEMRVGDQERREVDARLQAAHADGMLTLAEYDERAAACWAARTQGELAAVTRDLPVPRRTPTETVPVPQEAAAEPVQRSRSPFGQLVGTLGGLAVGGVLIYSAINVLGAADGATVFGNRELDVSGQDRVEVGMMFGNVEVVVPDGTHVRSTGSVIFGKFSCETACRGAAPGAPQVVVDASGAFGNIKVLTTSERDLAQATDRDRDHDGD